MSKLIRHSAFPWEYGGVRCRRAGMVKRNDRLKMKKLILAVSAAALLLVSCGSQQTRDVDIEVLAGEIVQTV